jgi:hypothetical protein
MKKVTMTDESDCSKKSFPKGYWSRKGKPTQNALNMFFVYITNRPNDWDETKGKRHKDSLEKTRQYFGVDYGIECMLTWGIHFGCKNSETSDERYQAMALAHHDALGMIGKGYHLSIIKLKD